MGNLFFCKLFILRIQFIFTQSYKSYVTIDIFILLIFSYQFRVTGTSVCLDTMGRKLPNNQLGASGCHGFGGNQEFRLSKTGRIQFDEYCLMPSVPKTYARFSRCRESHRIVGDVEYWSFSQEVGLIRLKETNLCINVDTSKKNEVTLAECDPNSSRQKFTVNKVA